MYCVLRYLVGSQGWGSPDNRGEITYKQKRFPQTGAVIPGLPDTRHSSSTPFTL